MNNLHIIDFNYSTNFNYDMIKDSDTLSTIGIDDSNIQTNEIPIFSESVTRIYIEMDEPYAYDFSSFPDVIEIINIKTAYDGNKNEDTIYGLENYPNLEHYSYDNALSENLFGIFKREWAKDKYANIEELKNDVDIFVHNYNNFRLYSKLRYKSPVEYRLSS